MKEFIDCGPRLVRKDEGGPYVIYKGDIVRSPMLVDYVGQKVHVTASLSGDGWQISEWVDRWLTPGRWWARYGQVIANVTSSARNA